MYNIKVPSPIVLQNIAVEIQAKPTILKATLKRAPNDKLLLEQQGQRWKAHHVP